MFIIVNVVFFLAAALKSASSDQAAYIFWYHAFDFTNILFAPLFLVFVLTYVDKQELLFRPTTWLSLYGVAFFLIPLTIGVLLSDPSKAQQYSFGYPNVAPIGAAGGSLTLWTLAIFATSFALLLQYYNQVKAIASKRKLARLFLIGTIVPLVLGLVVVAILPWFHIDVPLDAFIPIIQISIIGYALLRYKLFSIDPTALADTILAAVNESVITVNNAKEIEFLNAAAQRLLGVSLNEVRGHRLSKLFDKDTAQKILHIMRPNAETESVEFDMSIHASQVPINLTTSKIIFNDSIEGYILVFRDISKERAIKHSIELQVIERTRELNDEHARLQAAMDSLDVGLLMTFKDREAVSYNAMLPKILAEESHGHGRQDKLTLSMLQEKLLPTNFDLMKAIDACQQTDKPFEVNEIAYGNRILRIYGAPISHHMSGVIGTVVLVDDITETKILERSKDEFFSIASHELRTPLTSIKGNTSMIMSYYKDALKDESLNEMIGDIHESSIRLISIVNDFLDMSRLEQRKISFHYEAVSIEEIIENVIYEMQTSVKEKQLDIKLDKMTLGKLPKVWVDKDRLKQIVYNVVGNAVKFTDKGSITISAQEHGKFVKVVVTDTGRGIAPEMQPFLFHKFQQAGKSLLTRDTTRGTGLGLYISKMIVESMGGKIQLEQSKEAEGSVFSFTVLITTPELQASSANAESQTDIETGLSTNTEHK